MARKAIVIVGGSVRKDDQGRWRTTLLSEGDEHGALGDRLRVIAGAMLYKEETSQKIIALGGRGQLAQVPNAPAVADIIKKELIACDVPVDAIITETESGNTFQQLQSLKKILHDYDFQRVLIVSNTYHLPRIEAMIEMDVELKHMLNQGHIELRSAEEILVEREPERKEEIDRAYASKQMQERIKKEQEGVSQLKEGTYKLQ